MANTTQGPSRQQLEPSLAQQFEALGTLVHDERRQRSFFFDGRFLTAKDLTREQAYFLTRQADLGRGGGVGVITGLQVTVGTVGASTLTIKAGHGVTPSGESVVIPRDLENVQLNNIPEIQRLDAAFGLAAIPHEAAISRSGLFVVALRAVEYTANPVAAYPSSAGGTRTAHDGDIIEATAITLIPYPELQRGIGGSTSRRARVAHEIFVRKGGLRPAVNALPIAMIELRHGAIQWVDTFLVRREVGSEQTDFLGFGQAPRALREAHLQHYQQHLSDVLAERRRMNNTAPFLASDYFDTLPPAGPLPRVSVNTQNFTEVYFPPEVDVELAVIPDDELGALLEESLFLSPIDLKRTGEELASTAVLVMIPVPRAQMDTVLAGLFPTERTETMRLRTTAQGLVALQRPGDALMSLVTRSTTLTATEPDLNDAVWRRALAQADTLWYARRRSFPYKPSSVGQPVEEPDEGKTALTKMLEDAGLYDEFGSMPSRATALAITEFHALWLKLTAPEKPVADKPPAFEERFVAAAGEVLRQKRVFYPAVVDVIRRFTVYTAPEGYTAPTPGKGIELLIDLLKTKHSGFKIPQPQFARSTLVPELDQYVSLANARDATEPKENRKLLAVVKVVHDKLAAQRTLDEAVAEIRTHFSPNAPY